MLVLLVQKSLSSKDLDKKYIYVCVYTHVSGSPQVLEGLQQPKDADPEWLISDSWEMLSDPEPGDEKECGY